MYLSIYIYISLSLSLIFISLKAAKLANGINQMLENAILNGEIEILKRYFFFHPFFH